MCHYPPGTSKWNRIEHRLFSFISMNWRVRLPVWLQKRAHDGPDIGRHCVAPRVLGGLQR